ncbi:hypothetical protein BS50DRAFT_611200 [Corynespora cassiicola Philippines]|uniref:Structure-specific endonuclease subunit SLX4 n=1 Tax=Corynespora cassiicola Philippines TaxID=1448308 RepID=A0A2T2NI80_CORCC|nr:hypothetical protein BS50DRAFT_611200 [Corynespora cassiicola Philippines]
MSAGRFNLVLLSSSPPSSSGHAPQAPPNSSPPSSQRVHTRATSPASVPPPTSTSKTTTNTLKSGSRAVPIPEGLARGFATAGELVRSRHFALDLDDDAVQAQQVQSRRSSLEATAIATTEKAVKKPSKRTTKEATTDEGVASKPKPKPRVRKTKAKQGGDEDAAVSRAAWPTASSHFSNPEPTEAVDPTAESAVPLAKPQQTKPRKPRAKKPATESSDAQPKAQNSRVSKKSARKPTDSIPVPSHDEDVAGENNSIWEVPQSPHRKSRPPKQRPPDAKNEALELEEAVARRRDWTPPRDTEIQEPLVDLASKENNPAVHQAQFTGMLANFAYGHKAAPLDNDIAKPAPSEEVSLTKRRKVELVDVPSNHAGKRSASPEKAKAPKKKPRTITDLVTGNYAVQDLVTESEPNTSNLFVSKASTTKIPLNDVAVPEPEKSAKPARKRSTSKDTAEKDGTKPKAKRKTTKSAAKPKMVAEKLLSPASAALRLSRQDVLFGTSSQLAIEESPAMIREIQRALQESEQEAELQRELDSAAMPPPPVWPRLDRIRGGKGLWGASSRDGDGMLLQKQDVYIPEPDRTQEISLLMDKVNKKTDDSFIDIDDIAPPPVISLDVPTPQSSSHDAPMHGEDPNPSHMSFDDIDNYQEPPPSNQNVHSSFIDIDEFPAPNPPAVQYSREEISESAIPIDSTRNRSRPAQPRRSIPQIKSASNKQLLRTPNKKGRFADIEEILDSEDDEALSPTPPRTRKLQDSPPLQFSPSATRATMQPTKGLDEPVVVSKTATSQLQWENIKSKVYAAITSHVRHIPPTTNLKSPSWHEKILMYDPIVLEDFTSYLNASTAICTYKKATQKQIKAWNKVLKSRGEKLLKIEDGVEDEVLVVEKELETGMVQGWCQEMSICCVSKEGKGRSGVRKQLY